MSDMEKREASEADVMRYYDDQSEVVLLHVKGYTVTDIVRHTGNNRKQVEKHLADFKEFAAQDKAIRLRARDIVLSVDVHYSDIVKNIYRQVEAAEFKDDHKAAMTGLKMIADTEAKRVELLSKAGMIADNTIGDQIAESEKKQAILVEILKEISREHPDIGRKIQKRLSEVTGRLEGVIVETRP